jgi:Tol biopolymer transport system component
MLPKIGSVGRLAASLALATLLAASLTEAQGIRLNRELPRRPADGAGGDVLRVELSPDGSWAVYVADETDEVYELYSVPVDGSGPARRVNGAFAPGMGFSPLGLSYAVTNTHVLYIADQATDGAFELWSAPIDGSAPAVRISQALTPGAEVQADLDLTADGQRVLYRADPSINGVFGLWSAPVDGSQAPARVDVAGGDLEFDGNVAVAPDGSAVVYLDDEGTPGVFELWRAPVDGSSAPVRVQAPLAGFADVSGFFRISPDSTRVVYIGDTRVDGAYELWSVPLDGSALPTSLSGALPNDRGVPAFELASDSSGVVFLMDKLVDGRLELFWSSLAGGGPPALLSGALVSGGDVYTMQLSPDGATAVFIADAELDGLDQLYSVPTDASRPRLRLSEPNDGNILGAPFDITPGGHVVYRTLQNDVQFYDLWSVPLEGGTRVHLNPAGEVGQGGFGGVQTVLVDPTGTWVNYSFETPRGPELWAVRSDGSQAPRALERARHLTAGSNFHRVTSTRSVYVADAETDELYELWSAPVDGTGSSLRLNSALDADPIAGDVSGYLWLPEGERVLYRADQERDEYTGLHLVRTDERPMPQTFWDPIPPSWPFGLELSADGNWLAWHSQDELFTAPIDGSQPPIERYTASTYSDSWAALGSPWITPDSQRVVYVTRLGGSHSPPRYTLYSAPIAGGAAVPLSQNDTADEIGILRTVVSSDSRNVVYLELADGVPGLYRAPIAGGAPAARLHEPLGLQHDIDPSFQLTPDGRQVVFVADLEGNDVFQLYSVPLTRGPRRLGVPLPVRLNAPLGLAQDVDFAFRISPDGARVVYAADQDQDEVFELFSVPVRGGAAPVKLSGPMVTGGDVGLGIARPSLGRPLAQFELAPDGSRVVYRADQVSDEVFELFSAPLDGSSAPVRLHPDLAPDGDVGLLSARVDPSSSRVVFGADLLADEVLELFAAPIDGSAAPLRLSVPFVSGGDLATRTTYGSWEMLEIAPSGEHVAYLADQDQDEVVELYAVPLDASTAPLRMNAPLVAGGDVRSLGFSLEDLPPFRFSPDGRQLVYVADQRTDEVMELFLSHVVLTKVRPARGPATH